MTDNNRDYVAELQSWVDREQREHGLISISFDVHEQVKTSNPTRPQRQQAAKEALAMIAYARA